MTTFYLEPEQAEALADRVADEAASLLQAIPAVAPSCCDGELDQALSTVFRLASVQVHLVGSALVGQARAARSAVALYRHTDRRLAYSLS